MYSKKAPHLRTFTRDSEAIGVEVNEVFEIEKVVSPDSISYFAPGIMTQMDFEKPRLYAKTSFDLADNICSQTTRPNLALRN